MSTRLAEENTSATAPPPAGRRHRRLPRGFRLGPLLIKAAVLLGAATLWEIYARLFPSLFVPPITKIIGHAWKRWTGPDAGTLFLSSRFLDMVGSSFARLLPGLLIGAAAGIILGVALARIKKLGDVCTPLVHFLRAIPSSAKIPLFIVLLGIGDAMKVWVIGVTVAFPLLINVMDGVRNVEPTLLDMARVYGAGRWNTLRRIILPAAMPQTFAGLRIATMVALIVMVLAEMMGATDGIGYSVLYAERKFQVLDMWAGVFVLGLVGYLLNAVVSFAEHRILSWHRQSSAGAR